MNIVSAIGRQIETRPMPALFGRLPRSFADHGGSTLHRLAFGAVSWALMLCPIACGRGEPSPVATPGPTSVGASANPGSNLLPADRRTVWNPGIPGGIPNRTTVCATLRAPSGDATAAIQSALDACPNGQVVQLTAGTFKIGSGPIFLTHGITLRGAGAGETLLTKPSGTNEAVVVIGRRWKKATASVNLTATAVKGSTSVSVSSASAFATGQLVLLDKTSEGGVSYYSGDCDASCQGWFARPTRPVSQTMEIASISGNTVSFTTPFHISFDVAHGAQMTAFDAAAVKNAGLENLKVHGGEGGDGGGNIYLELAASSWVQGVESEWSVGASVRLYNSLRCVIRDSYFHETPDPNPGGAGYGIDISMASSDNLIENNISWPSTRSSSSEPRAAETWSGTTTSRMASGRATRRSPRWA